jgi:oligopeptide transport system permease protein
MVVTLTFFLMHLAPGDPFAEEQPLAPEVMDALRRHFHLDQSIFSQYLHYLDGILHGEFGPSLRYQGRSAEAIIADGFPVSLTLGCEALLYAVAFGTLLGLIAAWKRGKWQDTATMLLAILGVSVPSFLIATFLQYIFAMKLGLLPVARWGTFAHTLLPALSLAALPTAFIARLIRASTLEVLEQDYILTARAKGLSPQKILLRHTLRNAFLPVITYLGPLSASVFTGSFVVEKIFAIPGLGQWFVLSVMGRDYTVIMALTIFYSSLLMVAVFIVDCLYSLLDPRIQWRSAHTGESRSAA